MKSKKKDLLFRPKTHQVRATAKMAPPEVWDDHIISTLQNMIDNAKRAKEILLAQSDPDANPPHDDVQAVCNLQGQTNAVLRDLVVTYP